MELTRLIQHPEEMSKETLYDLRALLALYPYYQTARLLMLQNLYLLHDPSFNEELKRAAIYITDRRVIFRMIEAAHYKFKKPDTVQKKNKTQTEDTTDRTSDLIDSFLDSIPAEQQQEDTPKGKRKPTPADATVDYVAYLMQTADNEQQEEDNTSRTVALIDGFMEEGGFQLPKLDQQEMPAASPESGKPKEAGTEKEQQTVSDSIYTETFAHIYIKQKKYDRALDIIERLQKRQPTKSAYYTDQMRFLEKLIINNKATANVSNKQ